MIRIVCFTLLLIGCGKTAEEETPVKEKASATKEVPVKTEAPAKEAPAKEAPVKEAPAKEAPKEMASIDASMVASQVDAGIGKINVDTLQGLVGFDWFKSSTCVDVGAKLAKTLTGAKAKCERSAVSPFGDDKPVDHIRCKVGQRHEWLLFETQKMCIEMSETMEANAP